MQKITPFEHFIQSFCNEENNWYLPKKLGQHKITMGKVLSKPETAKPALLLQIARLIEVSPYRLIEDWNVSIKHLSKEEIAMYKRLDKLSKDHFDLKEILPAA